jgi:hypothetical protein
MVRRPRPSARRIRRARSVLVSLVGLAAAGLSPAAAQEALSSIDTPGRAKLQICRSWLVMRTCNEYSRVDVPSRIAVGDRLFLEFGSNPKSMTFAVSAIRLEDGTCTLFTEPPAPDTDESEVDKLTIAPCRKAG